MVRKFTGPLFALLTFSVAAPGAGLAQSGPLDGKSFVGTFVEKGKTKGDADTLVFKDGRFRSLACDQYGYGDAPYTAIKEGDVIRFEAETESSRYGKLIWKGIVRGEQLESTALSVRSGRAPIENIVNASLKK